MSHVKVKDKHGNSSWVDESKVKPASVRAHIPARVVLDEPIYVGPPEAEDTQPDLEPKTLSDVLLESSARLTDQGVLIRDLEQQLKVMEEDRDEYRTEAAEARDALKAYHTQKDIEERLDVMGCDELAAVRDGLEGGVPDFTFSVAAKLEKQDPTNPSHYRQGSVECIDAIKSALGDEGFKSFCQGNAIKYLWRYQHKGKAIEDLKKSEWYTCRLKGEL